MKLIDWIAKLWARIGAFLSKSAEDPEVRAILKKMLNRLVELLIDLAFQRRARR